MTGKGDTEKLSFKMFMDLIIDYRRDKANGRKGSGLACTMTAEKERREAGRALRKHQR